MVTRKTTRRRSPKPVAGLRGKVARKLKALADVAKSTVAGTTARVTKAAAKAEIKARAVARKAGNKLTAVRRSTKKEVAVVRKAVKAKAASVERTAKRRIAEIRKVRAPAKRAAKRRAPAS